MKRVLLSGVDPADLADAAGAGGCARGLLYYQQGAVARVWWDEAQRALLGTVRGRSSEFYSTTAFFSLTDGEPPRFEHGRCSCPVGFNCKHVVALVLAGSDTAPDPDIVRPSVPAPRRPDPAEPPAWEQSLAALLETGPDDAARRPGAASIAIELTLVPAARPYGRGTAPPAAPAQPPRLVARLVQPGKNGRWISGQLSWGKLDSLHYQSGYLIPQVSVLRELRALHRSHDSQWAYYSHADDKVLDLSAFESAQLWPLLDQARAVGLRLVYAGQRGDVPASGPAELCLDVTRRDPSGPLMPAPLDVAPLVVAPLDVAPLVRVPDPADAAAPPAIVTPLRFLGTQAHGVVYARSADVQRGGDPGGWPFRLARLTRPVPPPLQRMALAGQQVQVPAAEQDRFRDDYFPRLRRTATVLSSDGSFTPPRVSGPVLVLRAAYGDGHEVEISWEWSYQVGDTARRAPLTAEPAVDAGYRDLAAERQLLGRLDLPLARFGLLRPALAAADQELQRTLLPRVRLGGLDTMRFSTELLPLAASQPGIRVEITGDPPDYRAADDTLHIVMSTDEVAGETDWFDLGVEISAAGYQVPFSEVFAALSRGEPDLLLPDGAYFSLRKPELQALARLISEARALQETPGESLRISRFQADLWDELTELGVVSHQAAQWERQVSGLLSGGGIEQLAPPPGLLAQLRPYQLDGFRWLAFLWQHQLGGILADDMGLGKTLQSLALIGHARQAEPGLPPFLIVAPTSVVPGWAAEAARFAPDLRVVPVTETAARRGQDLAELIQGADAVVTSYALLRIDFDAYARAGWSGLILDEAQHAKNHQSRIHQCARRLAAPFKLAITGTPMENNLMELWSLLSITAPGLFPSPARFRDYYARPIEQRADAELLAQLRRRIRPLIRRRTKEQVAADLPAKQQQVLEVELHPRHRRVYQTQLQRERQKVLRLIDDIDANRFTILRSLTLLRQLSLHAGLVDDAHADLPCAKIDALTEQLGDVTGGGHRALVFSQFTGFLGKVAERLDAVGLRYCYLDGKTRNRAAVLREFRDGAAPVFLISLKAGGFGLNLTEADYCFLLDPWWNPATEAQAIDRIHRIGQTRRVMVYRLISAGTIEEKVLALQARKAELFTSVMDTGDTFGTALSADDIRTLLE